MAHGQADIKEEEAVNNVPREMFLEKEIKKGIKSIKNKSLELTL